MTETQAKSGSAGASANPVDEKAADGSAPAAGRTAIGRATVPSDTPSPKFTRAPGMPPPPDQPPAEATAQPKGSDATAAATGGTGAGSAAGKPDGKADQAKTSAGTAGADRPGATASSASSASSTDAVNATVPIPSGSTPDGSGRRSTGSSVGAQAKAAAASVLGLARSAGLGRFTPGGGAANRPDGGSPQTGTASTRPGTARSTALRPPGTPPLGGASAVGAARVTEAVRAARTTVGTAASRGPRRARLNVKRIDPWSVMKFSFAVSLVLFIVVIVATSVLYLALDAMGVFESVNNSLTDLINAGGGQGTEGFKITAKGVLLTSALVGLINVVLFTALATLGAFVYNVCADLVGGIEVTLAERD